MEPGMKLVVELRMVLEKKPGMTVGVELGDGTQGGTWNGKMFDERNSSAAVGGCTCTLGTPPAYALG